MFVCSFTIDSVCFLSVYCRLFLVLTILFTVVTEKNSCLTLEFVGQTTYIQKENRELALMDHRKPEQINRMITVCPFVMKFEILAELVPRDDERLIL
jgi:hypothetical protein